MRSIDVNKEIRASAKDSGLFFVFFYQMTEQAGSVEQCGFCESLCVEDKDFKYFGFFKTKFTSGSSFKNSDGAAL